MTKLRQLKKKAANAGKELSITYAMEDTMLTIDYGGILYVAELRNGETKSMMTERLCGLVLKQA